ncbi:hypothetical protein MBLNU230_g6087t1 [Neophaeotheca triangularis]
MEQRQQQANPPPVTSPNPPADDPHDFYRSSHTQHLSTAPVPEDDFSTPLSGSGMSADYGVPSTRSFENSASKSQFRSASGPPTSNPSRSLNGVKSNPVLLPSRPSGSVRDLANRFNQTGSGQPELSVRTGGQESNRRPVVGSKSSAPRSPTKGGKGEMAKLQKRRPPPAKSPVKGSPDTSFQTSSSFSSDTTISSTRSKPHAAFSPKQNQPAGVFTNPKPLFGEITGDGQWNGNFDLGNYAFTPSPRRSSDGSVALGHGRSQSHQDFQRPVISPPAKQTLAHKRSRSDMDAWNPQPAPSMPDLNMHETPNLAYPTPPHSGSRNVLSKDSPNNSRIPTRIRRQSADSAPSAPHSRSASAMSNPTGRRKLSKSPTRRQQAQAKENAVPSSLHSRRYNPPSLPISKNGQSLSAKIVAPPPQKSPPLRSSRPRQPVSSATTSASRARAAERFESSTSRDGRRPSEQWLGKPYDPQQERTRRRIPELGKVDFAERRARIQQAISQNLDDGKSDASSARSLSQSRSRVVSGVGGSLGIGLDHLDTTQSAPEPQQRLEDSETARPAQGGDTNQSPPSSRQRGLSLDTAGLPEDSMRDSEPATAHTEFEADESPVLGQEAPVQMEPGPMDEREDRLTELPTLLSSATYTPQAKANAPAPIEPVQEAPEEEVQSPSVLENVMRMRERRNSSQSRSDTEFADDSTADYSPSEMGDRWGQESSAANNDAGSIKIMLDNEPSDSAHHDQRPTKDQHSFEEQHGYHDNQGFLHTQAQNSEAYAANQFQESPVTGNFPDSSFEETPRKPSNRDDTLKPGDSYPGERQNGGDDVSDESTQRFLEQYQTTGTVTSDMVHEMQRRMVDMHHASANEGSNAMMVQNLLNGILQGGVEGQTEQPQHDEPDRKVQYDQHGIPIVTPDTPPDADFGAGTAVVYSNKNGSDGAPQEQEEDFDAIVRKADQEWDRKHSGQDTNAGAEDEGFRPPPPPKDFGYSPRSSAGPLSAGLNAPDLAQGLRISTSGHLDLPEGQSARDGAANTSSDKPPVPEKIAPPPPAHSPPPPPSSGGSRLTNGIPEMMQMEGPSSERPSNEMSPRIRKNLWGPTPTSSRPSTDSQRPREAPPVPSSVSMSSFADSAHQTSFGDAESSSGGKTKSPGPEQKRLQKRRYIIRELLDTEASYHQDLKIIEDIYKATAGDLISADDKKILFGNCDEIERFSLYFFDEMRKCVSSVYVPPKKNWSSKRTSMSTTQSDGTGATSTNSSELVDEDKDRQTNLGECFLNNMQSMEEVYGTYLRNHDAANARLGALQNTPTVKCWLDECHNNASDITSAWNLDSLLVKPAQRVAKYPMLLQQLCETTPASHPDFSSLTTASKDSISMLTRINEAKKRADLVDNLINRKRKDSDVRSGIAKAFGRRTEKLKERVGIAEAFQDPEFDELAHRFGGHFIRLQICMRDIQDYITQTDKAFTQVNNFIAALELFAEVQGSNLPEITSKWRRYGQTVREITTIALSEHKAYVAKRVIQPMIQCIKLHEGPQNAIAQRKKRIVDYAKCQSIEKRGEKPDKKTKEASDRYEALNDELKIGLPKLYRLTGVLVQKCLECFITIQSDWLDTWRRKLEPVLDPSELPTTTEDIEPAFRPDYEAVKAKLLELGICNGSLLADSYNFLSPTSTITGDSSEQSSLKRPSTLNEKRTMSLSSDASPSFEYSRPHSGGYVSGSYSSDVPPLPNGGRMRSNSSMSGRASGMPSLTPASTSSTQRPWSNSNTMVNSVTGMTPTSSFSALAGNNSRPSTANPPTSYSSQAPASYGLPPRTSFDQTNTRASNNSYFTARPDLPHSNTDPYNNTRFSGIFNSALPPSESNSPPGASTPAQATPPLSRASSTINHSNNQKHLISRRNTGSNEIPQASSSEPNVLFVCASLFEFNIDKARKEGGYPYLTYVQGEVFDVIAQKGELWLARNQDDANGTLGWIWEQHFVILSQEG